MRSPHRQQQRCFWAHRLFAFLLLLSSASAMTPPHPESDFPGGPWMTVHDYRRKLGRDYKYDTQLLHPEICRYEDEKACQAMDEAMQKQAHRTLASIQSTGNLKVLVLLIKFDNHRIRTLPDSREIDNFFNAAGKDAVNFPTGSIKSYLKVNSHNSLSIDADTIPWYAVEHTEQECAFGNLGLKKDFQKCFWPILDALDKLHNDQSHDFNWKDYDQNLDGMIDSLVVMHSGYGAEYGHTDPSGTASSNRIWSHSMGPEPGGSLTPAWKSQHTSISVGSYSVLSAFHGHEGQGLTKIGVVLHEMLHTMSLPYLFDSSQQDQGRGVGSYSIMSDPWGQGNDGSYPGHLDPYSKVKLGWVTPKKIISNGTYTMLPSEYETDIYIIDDPYPEGEYLLIENRQQVLYDAKMWEGAGGALIWHVDEKKNTQEAGGPYQKGWPENEKHYRVALLQADGLYELERNINNGHAGDFFTEGKELGPGRNGVYPNSDSYQSGNIASTGISIKGFEQASDFQITFTVSGMPPLDLATTESSFEDQGKCHVNVNAGSCTVYSTADFPLQDGCDCYNFCGNGAPLGCCKFGEPCPIQCESGGLVAGCQSKHLIASSSTNTGDENESKPALELPEDPSSIADKQPINTGNLRSGAPCMSDVRLLWSVIVAATLGCVAII